MDPKKSKNELIKENDDLKKELSECKNKYLRALADYQNLEKRTQEEKNEMRKYASAQVIIRLLPFLDNLERAQIFIKDEGLKAVKERLTLVLQEVGLEEISVLNKEFDPQVAEAIEVLEGKKENMVVEVVRKGYRLNGKVVQVAQVKVTKKH